MSTTRERARRGQAVVIGGSVPGLTAGRVPARITRDPRVALRSVAMINLLRPPSALATPPMLARVFFGRPSGAPTWAPAPESPGGTA